MERFLPALPGQGKGRPEERMAGAVTVPMRLEPFQLRLPHGASALPVPAAKLSKKLPISRAESLSGTCHRVATTVCAGQLERLPQPGHALARAHVAYAGLAGREDDQFGAAQVHADDFQTRQHAVILAGLHLFPLIATGQEQAATKQRVLGNLPSLVKAGRLPPSSRTDPLA